MRKLNILYKLSTLQLLFFISFAYFQGILCKLIPTQPPCSSEERQIVYQCRQDERQKLSSKISPKIDSFIKGIFIGKLLSICNSAEKYPKCLEKINQTKCQFFEIMDDIDFDVVSILSMCRYKYIYEEYNSIVNCLAKFSPPIVNCYTTYSAEILKYNTISSRQLIIKSNACKHYFDLHDCVVMQSKRFCQKHSPEFTGALVDAGISFSQICKLNLSTEAKELKQVSADTTSSSRRTINSVNNVFKYSMVFLAATVL